MWNWILNLFGLGEKEPAKVIIFPTPQKPLEPGFPTNSGGKIVADWPKEGWTQFAVDHLNKYGQKLLAANPKDWKEWFGEETDKVKCYAILFSCMARYESNFKPGTKYKEGFNDAKGRPVYSMGLLQLSIESANGNYGAGLKEAEELLDPSTNIRVAVLIFNKLVPRDGVISGPNKKGAGAYWSVIQRGHRNQKIAAVQKRCKELLRG